MKLLIERKYRKIYFDKFHNPFYKKKNSKIYINKMQISKLVLLALLGMAAYDNQV